MFIPYLVEVIGTTESTSPLQNYSILVTNIAFQIDSTTIALNDYLNQVEIELNLPVQPNSGTTCHEILDDV